MNISTITPSHLWLSILDPLIGQTVVTVRYVQTALGVAFNTAQMAIDLLEESGIVHQAVAGRRRNRT